MSEARRDTRPAAGQSPRVGLFVTCLVDLMRPNIGFAAVKLLEDAGCAVDVPRTQVCCGQPAYNSGDFASARRIAQQVIVAFEGFDYVVGPSGSCMATLRKDYPALFADDPVWLPRARSLAARSHELMSFLSDELHAASTPPPMPATATYHDSCSGLRGLGIKQQPRALLQRVARLDLVEMQDSDVCCGFGGTFCVKYPDISVKMVSDKAANVAATGADLVLGGDLGCLLNLAGRMRRLGMTARVFHAAEVLAGMANGPAIGEAEGPR